MAGAVGLFRSLSHRLVRDRVLSGTLDVLCTFCALARSWDDLVRWLQNKVGDGAWKLWAACLHCEEHISRSFWFIYRWDTFQFLWSGVRAKYIYILYYIILYYIYIYIRCIYCILHICTFTIMYIHIRCE